MWQPRMRTVRIGGFPATFCKVYETKEEARERNIGEEREREREFERKIAQINTKKEVIKYATHPHPLVYTESDYKRFICDVCSRKGEGKRYRCEQCNFDLHKICAQSPITWLLHQMPPKEIERFGIHHNVIRTFSHPQHSVIVVYKEKLFTCDHCNNVGNGPRYYCDTCNVMLHQVCAEHPTKLISHLHPRHELELKLRPHNKYCKQCGTRDGDKNNRMYSCKYCDFHMHPECSQLPLYLLHPLHPPHPLLLKRSYIGFRCYSCSEHGYSFKYGCRQCGVDFDRNCIIRMSIKGLNNEVRQTYADNKITLLPVANLTSSYAPKQDPPTN
ncbi:putative nucleoredoxin 1-2 [Bienertia sinuspersici]